MALDVDRVRQIAERVAASSGLEVVDIEFLGGGKARMLRVFLDKPAAGADPLAGVTHEDCANRKLVKAADYTRFIGSRVKLMTLQPVDNNQHFEGRLENFQDGKLTLDLSVASHKSRKKMGATAGKKIEIDFANVEKANLVPEI